MKITIHSSSMVKPATETPHCMIWNSNIDLVIPRIHVPTVYFYKGKKELVEGEGKHFSCQHLQETLARALVPFYPVAGRLKEADKGRVEIYCNGQGVLFVKASADGCISEFGEFFTPSMKMRKLVPCVNYSEGLDSYPLFVVQVTFFKCGGVAVGTGMQHHVVDGLGALRFLNYWATLSRGIEEDVTLFLDRTLLRARDPPLPKFEHIEYQPPPLLICGQGADSNGGNANGTYLVQQQASQGREKHRRLLEEMSKMNEERKDEECSPAIASDLFIFTEDQVRELKKKAAAHALPGEGPFTSYEVLSAHTWRCTCLARGLQDTQLSKLYIATDGRSRLQPPLPPDFLGNVIFTATPVDSVGHLVGAPVAEACRLIRRVLHSMDNEYLRSAIDYLELQPNLADISRGAHTFKTPNLGITSWVRLPIYEADFGWGMPLSMGPAGVPFEGLAYLLPGPPGDRRLRLSITLSPDHMQRFSQLIYEF